MYMSTREMKARQYKPSISRSYSCLPMRQMRRRLFSLISLAIVYLLNNVSSDGVDSHPLMVFQGSINGHQAVILLDQGANSNYVSTAFAERTGILQRRSQDTCDCYHCYRPISPCDFSTHVHRCSCSR